MLRNSVFNMAHPMTRIVKFTLSKIQMWRKLPRNTSNVFLVVSSPHRHKSSRKALSNQPLDIKQHPSSDQTTAIKKAKSKQQKIESNVAPDVKIDQGPSKSKTKSLKSSTDNREIQSTVVSAKVKKSRAQKIETSNNDILETKTSEKSSKLKAQKKVLLGKDDLQQSVSSKSKTKETSALVIENSDRKRSTKRKSKESSTTDIERNEIQTLNIPNEESNLEAKTKNHILPKIVKKQVKVLSFPEDKFQKTPEEVMLVSECGLIEDGLEENDKEGFKSFVEEFSLSYLPYVTTILQQTKSEQSKFLLNRWKVQMIEAMGLEEFTKMQKDTLQRGDNFHNCVQEKLSGKGESEIQLQEDNQGHWQSIEKVFGDVDKVIALEKRVYHGSLLYNGKFDCLAVFRGRPCVIDWKTSKKPKPLLSNTYDDPIQLAAYVGAINSIPVIPGVDKVMDAAVIIAYSEGHPAHVHMMDIKKCQKYWTKWLDRLAMYWTLKVMDENKQEKINI